MHEFANSHSLRDGICDLLASANIATEQNIQLLDYTIDLFNKNGLSSDYYGYHNVDHELEVTYVTLMSAINSFRNKKFEIDDVKYLFASALLHDFDPNKVSDRPHEKSVIDFINNDQQIQKLETEIEVLNNELKDQLEMMISTYNTTSNYPILGSITLLTQSS